MRRKRVNASRGVLFTWGMLTGLAFLFAIPQGMSDRLQLTYARVFGWPLAAGHGLTLAARPTTLPHGVTPEEYETLLANHRQIQNRIANLQAQLYETQRQNERLANLRKQPGWENVPIQLAQVVLAADQSNNELIVNRGRDHGVAVGQYVVNLNDQGGVDQSVSVIGTISSVDAKTAKVKLITDPGDPKIAVAIGNLNIRTFMEGRGGNTARISMVQAVYKVTKGDPIYAQKVPGLDVPIVAARITQCQRDRDNPLFWDITAEPVCDMARLSEVAVVVATALTR